MNDLKDYWQKGKVGLQQRNFEYIRYNNPGSSLTSGFAVTTKQTPTLGFPEVRYHTVVESFNPHSDHQLGSRQD